MQQNRHKIRLAVKERHAKCRDALGNQYDYNFNGVNPYKFKDEHDMETRIGKFDIKQCIQDRAAKLTETNQYGTYYKNIDNPFFCDVYKGKFMPKSFNRATGEQTGVCWKTESDATCAVVADSIYEKPNPASSIKFGSMYGTKKYLTDYPELKDNLKDKCRAVDKCAYHETDAGLPDCFSKELISKLEQGVTSPPDSMPDPQDPGLQEWLARWYGNKIPNTPAPQIMSLTTAFGCDGKPITNNKNSKSNGKPTTPKHIPISRREIDYLESLDPNHPDLLKRAQNLAILEEHIGWAATAEFASLCDKHDKADQADKTVSNVGVWPFKKSDKNEKEKVHIPIKYLDYYRIQPDATITDLNIPKSLPSVAQSVVNMVMKNVATKNLSARGLLAIHSTGSGKTCTATGVMEAFWETKRDIIYVSSIDALASNPPFKFHECAKRLSRFSKMSMDEIASVFASRKVRFMTFARLANRLKPEHREYVNINNSIIIIDEVHNLFRPLANQRIQHNFLEREILNVLKYPYLKLVILTATPGDNVVDAMKLINLVRNPMTNPNMIEPPNGTVEDFNRFVNDIRGLVSYYDLSSDINRFPVLIDQPAQRLPMSRKQFDKYVEAYHTVKKEWQNYASLASKNQLSKWWSGARRYANMLYKFDNGMSLSEFSSKLPALLTNLQIQYEAREKAYVYSAFHENRGSSHGILEIARQLQKHGWKPLSMSDLKKGADGVTPGKRYMIASQKETHLKEFLKVYNSNENNRGQLVHVMIATQNFNEGLDLKAVRHVHIFEPLLTMASDLQTLGRARRYCSHASLDKEQGEWTEKVWRYMAVLGNYDTHPDIEKGKNRKKKTNADGLVSDMSNKSIDEVVYETGKEKYKQLYDLSLAVEKAGLENLIGKSAAK